MSASRAWVLAATTACGVGASLMVAGPAAAAVSCAGERATIVGTNRNQTLVGTSGIDVIVARGGSDIIEGRGGRDVICGGFGHDELSGGAGADRIFGGPDGVDRLGQPRAVCFGDWLRGGAGDDRLVPGFDRMGLDKKPCTTWLRDQLIWDTSPWRVRIDVARGVAIGQGHDTFPTSPIRVVGSDFADLIDGSRGPDAISAGLGPDEIRAGAGDDKIDTDSGHFAEQPHNADLVYAGAGQDQIDAWQGSDRLYGGDGKDLIRPMSNGRSSDQVFAGSGPDAVYAEFAFTRGQTIAGGPGVDVLGLTERFANPRHPWGTGTIDMTTGRMTYRINARQIDLAVPGFENLSLGSTGDGSSWQVRGTDGHDQVHAFTVGGTTFDALGGDDLMSGGLGDDVYDGGPGEDTAQKMDQGSDVCRNVEHFDDVSRSCATAAS